MLKDAWSDISGGDGKGEGKGLTDAEEQDISGGSGSEAEGDGVGEDGGKWRSLSKGAKKGFSGKRGARGLGKAAGAGNGGSLAGTGNGTGRGGTTSGADLGGRDMAALPLSGPAIFYPLPKFEYFDIRNNKLERQVALDVVGDEGLERVEENPEGLYKALNKELSRLVSEA